MRLDPVGRPTGGPTPIQRWRRRRDFVIYAANRRLGFSQRMLADVFGLSPSRVCQIVAALDWEADARQLGDDPDDGRRTRAL